MSSFVGRVSYPKISPIRLDLAEKNQGKKATDRQKSENLKKIDFFEILIFLSVCYFFKIVFSRPYQIRFG